MLAARIPQHAFFSHSTAALLWGAPLPWNLERSTLLHVAVCNPLPRLHSRGLAGHQLDLSPAVLDTRDGLTVTSPARTWCDLATQLTLDDLVAVGDYFINRELPFSDRATLAAMLDLSIGKRGVRRLREALPLLSDRAESRPESKLRVVIVRAGLPTPEINHTLVDSEAGTRVRPDFMFRKEKVILEYQGDYHRTAAQWRRDMTRRSRLEAQGWRVMELNADDLKNPEELAQRIAALLNRR